jgi:hypothetical protein
MHELRKLLDVNVSQPFGEQIATFGPEAVSAQFVILEPGQDARVKVDAQ